MGEPREPQVVSRIPHPRCWICPIFFSFIFRVIHLRSLFPLLLIVLTTDCPVTRYCVSCLVKHVRWRLIIRIKSLLWKLTLNVYHRTVGLPKLHEECLKCYSLYFRRAEFNWWSYHALSHTPVNSLISPQPTKIRDSVLYIYILVQECKKKGFNNTYVYD